MSNTTGNRGIGARRRAILFAGVGLALLLTMVLRFQTSAEAEADTGEQLTVTGTSARGCSDRLGGSGTASYETSAEATGYLSAKLSANDGDWDLAIFDAEGDRAIGGGSSSLQDEVASAWVYEGETLVVQACRASGSSDSAAVSTELEPIPEGKVDKLSLVKVETPTKLDEATLLDLGLDLTEHGGDGYVSVILHGDSDAEALERVGLDYETVVPNLANQTRQNLSADRQFAREREQTALPSGRTTYRMLADYQQELKDLADDNPDLVRPITLNNMTYEGRVVEGIEITTQPNRVRDGKPVFLQMGLHHAREWPSGEHAIEWAYELINGYRSGDADLGPLVEGTRTIVIPVVNPDGFNSSRTAGEVAGHGNGQSGDALVNFATSPGEYRRKNCRTPGTESGICPTGASAGAAETGVDPNRNYGGFWGGPGASDSPESATYRGSGPFSEPETQNIRELVSERAVVTLITNHTFSNLVLRPPGIALLGDSVDEPLYQDFGAAMTAQNGYLNQKGFQLYDTSGTTEDWTYTVTGGLGFTFEIGCNQGDSGASFDPEGDCIGNFHPPFEQTVAEYEGDGAGAQNVGGGGNRAAYLIAQQSTANTDRHSLIKGKAPAGATLRVERDVATPTWEGYAGVDNPGPPFLDDSISSEMKVDNDGSFEFDVNPSTSPFVAQDRGRAQDGGPPQAEIAFSGDNTTITPPVGCVDFETTDPDCWNDHPFEIDASSDNDAATIAVEWASPVNDWDVKVFRDTDGDGTSIGEPASAELGQSAQGPTTEESTTIVSPETSSGKLEPGKYVIRMIDFASTDPATAGYDGSITFIGPEPFVAGTTQSWTFTCSTNDKVRFTKEITIDRGESTNLNLSKKCAAGGGGGGGGGNGAGAKCSGKKATIVGTNKGETIQGTKGKDVIVGRGGDDDIRGRGGRDLICGRSGDDTMRGGPGRDKISANSGKDKLRGGKGKDRLKGGADSDDIRGGGGNDTLGGGGGNDTLAAGRGADNLRGHRGKDKLRGGKGPDILRGGKGRDRCNGGPGKDTTRSCER